MNQITLKNTSLQTSRLGFGCAAVTSQGSPRGVERLLETALDLGITHFDVARLYGMGHCEELLGPFVRKHRERLTLATKFGLGPLRISRSWPRLLIQAARNSLRAIPTLEHKVRTVAQQLRANPGFDPSVAERSLRVSLRALRTDYIDIFLLHEADVVGANNDAMLEFLRSQVARGTIRYCGIASAFHRIGGNAELFPGFLKVLQFENSIIMQNLPCPGTGERALITHGAVSGVREITARARRHPDLTAQYSAAIGADCTDDRVVASLMLHFACEANPGGIVVFGTSSFDHLRSNVQRFDADQFQSGQLMAFGGLIAALFDQATNPRIPNLRST